MGTATTLKHDSATSTQAEFSWSFPGAPIRVNISLDLISRLRAELEQNHSNSTSGAEVGGVLLGHQDAPATLHIDDYVWVSSDERPDGRYHLDRFELKLLRSIYSGPVGFFRTQSEDRLHLQDEEIDFVGKHFHDPTNVVLLIRNSPQHTAGFFFWMEKGGFTPFSFMDFPLDAELLKTQAKSRSSLESVQKPTGLEPATLPVMGGHLKKIDPSETQPPRTVLPKSTRARISRRMLMALGVVFTLLPLAGVSAYILRDRGPFAARQTAPTGAAFPLQLQLEAQGNGLNIRWNPQSAPIITALEAHLMILEGDQPPRIVPLDQQQLTSGHIYYRSSAEQIRFQLEIVGPSGRVSKESVLALLSKPARSGQLPQRPVTTP